MTVKVRIEGEGLNFETETSLQKAAQVVAFFGAAQSMPTSDVTQVDNQRMLGTTSLSGRAPRQIISQASAKSNPQKIAAIGLYFKERGQDVFTRAEISEQFRRAGEQIPKNMGRDIKEAVRLGFVCESEGQRDEYFLTAQAETAIMEGFSSNNSASTKTRSSKPKARKVSASIQEPTNVLLKDITYTPNVESLPNYWKTKKGDRILWILKFGKDNNVLQMDNKDIEYVGRRLDDNIPSGNINALSETNRKRGNLSRNGAVYTLLGPGIAYLQKLNAESLNEN